MLADAGFLRRARRALEAGAGHLALHVRGPGTSGRVVYQAAAALLPAARGTGALLLVNDRVDAALALDADGVQLAGRSMDAADARALLGGNAWIGRSVHHAAAGVDAASAGADFLLVGTVYASASHPGRAGGGPERVAGAAAGGRPVIAIGGITPARVAAVRGAGAHGVAVLSAVWAAADPGAAVRAFIQELYDGEH